MKDEFNNYKINNPDGTSKENYDVKKQRFDNDNPQYVKEDSFSSQKELFSTSEINDEVIEEKKDEIIDNKEESTSKLSSISSTMSGTLGALIGTVAASVVAVVVIVVAYISTLSINLSLVMADINSLVFEVQMKNAKEEDYLDPIYITLEGPEGLYQEQLIEPQSLYMTFDDLEAGKEYLITVKNSKQVFVKKSYFTSLTPVLNGEISSHFEENTVIVYVGNVSLSAGEYYTLIAKDSEGNIYYSKDGTEENAEYSFELPTQKDLYFSLVINGNACATSILEYSEAEPVITPEYNLENPTWTWGKDVTGALDGTATVSFEEIHGEDPLVLDAEVAINVIEATCDAVGDKFFTATVTYGGKTYTDNQHETIEAYGHTLNFVEEFVSSCEEDGMEAHNVCVKCGKYFDENEIEVTEESLIIPASGHDYGDLISTVSATSTSDGMLEHYECSVCHKLFDVDKNEVSSSDLIIPKYEVEYNYDEPTWTWGKDAKENLDGTATVSFEEIHGEDPLVLDAEVAINVIDATCDAVGDKFFTATVTYGGKTYTDNQHETIESYGHTLNFVEEFVPSCEEDGMEAHNICVKCGKYFDENEIEVTEEDLIIPALGHDYGDLISTVSATSTSDGMLEHYECSVCHKLFDVDKNEVSSSDLIIPKYQLEYDYDNPTWTWGKDVTGALDGTATVSFEETHGEEPLVIEAIVTEYTRSSATCEDPEIKYYKADTSNNSDVPYTSSESEDFEYGSALGHEYGELIEEISADCETEGTKAHYHCSVCDKNFDTNKTEINNEELVISALGHSYGDLHEEVPASCEEAGFEAYYECSVCHKLFDENKVEKSQSELTIPILGNGTLTLLKTEDEMRECSYSGGKVVLMTQDKSAAIKLGASNNTSTDGDYTVFTLLYVNTGPKVVITYPNGDITYYLVNELTGSETSTPVSFDSTTRVDISVDTKDETAGMLYLFVYENDSHYYLAYDGESIVLMKKESASEVPEENRVYMYALPTHTYGSLIEEVAAGCETEGTKAHYHCSVCGKYFDEDKNETTLEALAIPPSHSLGELIEATDVLAAHYECSVCHKLFDENKVETTVKGLSISGVELNVTRITSDMVPSNDDHPTAAMFAGFEAVSWDTVRRWVPDQTGEVYLIYGFGENSFYYCVYKDGIIQDTEANSTPATNNNLRLFVVEYGFKFYYTRASVSGD